MKWTTEKVEELRRRYPHEDNGKLARELGCSRKALVFRASTLGLRKTDAANEARYAAMSKRPAAESLPGERREIATGTLIVRGNVLTHLSNYSASREPARANVEETEMDEGGASLPLACEPAAQPQLAPIVKGGQGGLGQARIPPQGEGDSRTREARPRITCPRCQAQFTHPALAAAQTAFSMEA